MTDGAAKPHRIDVHFHLCPPNYLDEVTRRADLPPFQQRTLKNGVPEKALEDMDRAGVATSIMSITTPGVWLGDDAAARRLARECNDYGAKLRQDHPGRFGFFAALPLPDIDGSLKEIAYALDELKADGIGFYTSYPGNKYLGDPSFAPIFAELDRRGAVAYTHPVSPACCSNLVPQLSDAIIEFGTDTTRTIASLLFTGAASRYRRVKFIFSHTGGTLTSLATRFIYSARNPAFAAFFPDGIVKELQRFWYDTAQSTSVPTMAGFTKLVPVSKLMFGTDFPFGTAVQTVSELAECGFTAAELSAIERDNALALLPQLKR
jgi:predicted TIM-barrel fold metal-dependent hydrolase